MGRYRFSEVELSLMERACVPFAVYQFIDKHVVTLAITAGFCELFGYERDEAYYLMDNDMYHDTHPDDVARIADAALLFATEGGDYDVYYRTQVNGEYRIIHALGEHVYMDEGVRLAVIWYTYEGLYDENADSFEDAFNHALNKALHEETLCYSSRYDRLTGLPNMTYFFEIADVGRRRMIEDGCRPAIMYFNLSGMKYFNHRHGFSEGDKLIKAVGKVLVKYFGNDNCGRFGKDHFAAFASEEKAEKALPLIIDECKAINGGLTLPIRSGVYLDAEGMIDIGTACDRAKYACDQHKELYKSAYVYFDGTMLAETENRQYIIDNLDRAIEEQWIQVFYQPIVRAANGRVCDEEALARWFDPSEGMLSPAEFIPVLEDVKLIYKLDLYVLDQVLEKMKRQAEEGMYVVPQSLNLSRADFDSVDIVDAVCRRVDAAGISRDKLTIEITESVLGSDFDFMKSQIERFQEQGFQVWMDDFGSGYSSLDVLQNIKFDLIKLDMRFMDRFDERDESKVILTELVRMAIGLGVDTVAEGVETEEQVAFLREIGCNKLQGYYYSKPIPLSGIVERKKMGTQIGFENPDEARYFSTIGKANLYDPGIIMQEEDDSYRRYFDTIPMAIFEVDGKEVRVTRSNRSYRDYMEKTFSISLTGFDDVLPTGNDDGGKEFVDLVCQCSESGMPAVLDEETSDTETTHSIIRRIAVNPVTGTAALVVAVLAVVDTDNHRAALTYSKIARALASDYHFIFYVNLDTEDFIEYSSDSLGGGLSIEQKGIDFFQTSRTNARELLGAEDQERFIDAFTKDNVVRQIDEQGAFFISYRMFIEGALTNMIMKAVRIGEGENHIIIGVTDVENQVMKRKDYERAQSERIAFERLATLVDDYLCIYIVDLETERYSEYRAATDYDSLGISSEGENFFSASLENSAHTIHEDDRAMFSAAFTRDNIVREIQRNKSFTLNYRLVIDGDPTAVILKAVIVNEKDGRRLVVSIRGE